MRNDVAEQEKIPLTQNKEYKFERVEDIEYLGVAILNKLGRK